MYIYKLSVHFEKGNIWEAVVVSNSSWTNILCLVDQMLWILVVEILCIVCRQEVVGQWELVAAKTKGLCVLYTLGLKSYRPTKRGLHLWLLFLGILCYMRECPSCLMTDGCALQVSHINIGRKLGNTVGQWCDEISVHWWKTASIFVVSKSTERFCPSFGKWWCSFHFRWFCTVLPSAYKDLTLLSVCLNVCTAMCW